VSGAPLLFCVGAAKAGTSWLHRVLSDHPGCALRSIKELHFFDALDRGEVDRQVAAVEARRAAYLADMDGAGPVRTATRARQVKDCDDWLSVLKGGGERAYLKYLTAGAEGRMVADMTPAYALLSEERLRGMAEIGAGRAVPLPRPRPGGAALEPCAHDRGGPGGEGRQPRGAGGARPVPRVPRQGDRDRGAGDYAAAIGKLVRAVDPRRLMVAVTEEMFTAEGLARIMAFLGLSVPAADFSRRIHEGAAGDLAPAGAGRGAGVADAQYDFVAGGWAPPRRLGLWAGSLTWTEASTTRSRASRRSATST
jgi:hypothetical protein